MRQAHGCDWQGADATVSSEVGVFSGAGTIEFSGFGDELQTAFVVQNARGFFGESGLTADTADDWGVELTAGQMVGLILPDGTVAFQADGDAAGVNLEELEMAGSLSAVLNTTGEEWTDFAISAGGKAYSLTAALDAAAFSGSLTLTLPEYYEIGGDFEFQRAELEGQSTVILTGTGITSSLAAGENSSLDLTDGLLAAFLQSTGTGAASWAALVVGAAELVTPEDSDVTFSGDTQIRINRLQRGFAASQEVDGTLLELNFGTEFDVSEFVVTGTLSLAGFVDITGDFLCSPDADFLLVSTDGEIFVGMDLDGPDERGLVFEDATAVLAFSGGLYAAIATGAAGLAGLPGMTLEGELVLAANLLGTDVNVAVPLLAGGSESLAFETADEIQEITSEELTFSVLNVFSITCDANVTKTEDDLVYIDMDAFTAAILVNGEEVIEVGGTARFGIGISGFEMLDVGLDSFAVFGVDILQIAGGMKPIFTLPDKNAPPEPAELYGIEFGIDEGLLNRRKYIDVRFRSPGEAPLDGSSILDTADEFKLEGDAVRNVKLTRVEKLTDDIYRYHLAKKDTSDPEPMFAQGKVNIVFAAGAWKATDDAESEEHEIEFDVQEGAAETPVAVELGPLTLEDLRALVHRIWIQTTAAAGWDSEWFRDFSHCQSRSGAAELKFGEGDDESFSSLVEGLIGNLDVLLYVSAAGTVTGAGVGKFSIGADLLRIKVPDVLEVEAHGITIGYNPSRDANGDGVVSSEEDQDYRGQELLSIEDAEVKILKLGLTGSLRPHETGDEERGEIPGLVVRMDGFHLGEAEIMYKPEDHGGDKIKFGSFLELDDIRAGISDFGLTVGTGVEFNGQVFIASGGAVLFPGKKFSMTFADGPDDAEEAVRAALSFTNGRPSGFQFNSDRMQMKISDLIEVNGENIIIDTEAEGEEHIVSVQSIGAKIKVGSIRLGAELRSFAITASGNFQTLRGFGVFVSAETASGENFKWPSWLPIRITELGIQWADINAQPERFSFILSASVTEIKGIPNVTVSGAVKGIRVDPSLLLEGKFPITDVESIAVSMKGTLFGGTINAGLLGGILKLDASGDIIGSLDTSTPVADRVFFIGVEGGFEIAGKGGISIRFAVSELGPLGVQVVGTLPEGILLEPISGLKLSGFSGSVEFFTSLPDVYDPEELLDDEFAPKISNEGAPKNFGGWLETVRQQVADQHKALKENPVAGGFFAAFLNPMVISAGAEFTLHPPKKILRGVAEVRLSTDGKILLSGDILLLDGLQRIPVRIYGNLSQIARGNATLLLMAQDIPAGQHPILPGIPSPLPFLTPYIPILTSLEIRGAITMRYYDSSGNEVEFFRDEESTPTGVVGSLYAPHPQVKLRWDD
ncbi:MAG UNVERIFIED_CONTAM: hypothetical protein LVR18_14500 [Planctomycetaceae bacterium]